MKGSMSVVITIVILALLLGLYFLLLKGKLEEQRAEQEATKAKLQQELVQIEDYRKQIPELRALLPRWKEQFEIFRQAIPVKMEDDVFLRNLEQQLRANNVRLMAIELNPAGQWFSAINEVEEANYRKENVKPEELRLVKVANFSVSLMGDFGDVLRAFENLKLYGRVYSLDRIVGPSGGAGGAVFQNEDVSRTPIQVSGRIFYGLSENYLSQETLDKYFGRAEALGAASAIFESATRRADELSVNPTAVPMAPAPGSTPPVGAPTAPDNAAGGGGDEAAAAPPAAGQPASSANSGASRARVAKNNRDKPAIRPQAAGG